MEGGRGERRAGKATDRVLDSTIDCNSTAREITLYKARRGRWDIITMIYRSAREPHSYRESRGTKREMSRINHRAQKLPLSAARARARAHDDLGAKEFISEAPQAELVCSLPRFERVERDRENRARAVRHIFAFNLPSIPRDTHAAIAIAFKNLAAAFSDRNAKEKKKSERRKIEGF